jgi:ABC-type thiamin/hydroxymethylpyrimidine transport system permease subunit
VTRADALILRTAAAWTIFIWVTRIRNILGDDARSTGFKVVHSVLALVSVAFAIAILGVASRNRRRARDNTATPS